MIGSEWQDLLADFVKEFKMNDSEHGTAYSLNAASIKSRVYSVLVTVPLLGLQNKRRGKKSGREASAFQIRVPTLKSSPLLLLQATNILKTVEIFQVSQSSLPFVESSTLS